MGGLVSAVMETIWRSGDAQKVMVTVNLENNTSIEAAGLSFWCFSAHPPLPLRVVFCLSPVSQAYQAHPFSCFSFAHDIMVCGCAAISKQKKKKKKKKKNNSALNPFF